MWCLWSVSFSFAWKDDVYLHPNNVSGRDEEIVDAEQREAFEKWKSKTYALTVPLRIVALQGSVPPAWIKVCQFV